jgi:hypothetical protein
MEEMHELGVKQRLGGELLGVLQCSEAAVLFEGLADISGHRWNIAVLLLTTLRD